MIINRTWAMPNSNTFEIKQIRNIILKYKNGLTIDPFSRDSKLADITNDIDPECNSDYHMDALDFLRKFENCSVDTVLYDPPYSVRQVSECYKKLGKSVNMETTSALYWTKQKQEISRIVKPNGIVICFGWNSGGIGSNLGFEIIEILLVAHGGWHNDTIVTVCKKC